MSAITLDPYLFFTGNCKEAMEFYKEVFGGELKVMMNEGNPEMAGTVMHAYLSGGDATLMASDGTRKDPYETSFISLSLGGSDAERLTELFNKLADGGKVTSALKTESWGDTFGSLTDKFGVDWQVNISSR